MFKYWGIQNDSSGKKKLCHHHCFTIIYCLSRNKLANSLLNSYLLFPELLQAHLTFLTLLLYTGYANIMYHLFQKLLLSLIWFILGPCNHYILCIWSSLLSLCFFIYEMGRLMIPQVMGTSGTCKRVYIVVAVTEFQTCYFEIPTFLWFLTFGFMN